MPTENNTGIQTRAMAEAQCIENEANPDQLQDAPNPAMNPTWIYTGPRRKPSRSLSDNMAQFPLIGMYQTFTTLE